MMILTQSQSYHHNKNKPYRHRVAIDYQILEAVSRYPGDGVPRYKLQCLAEISTNQMCTYIPFLVSDGLLFETYDNREEMKHKGNAKVLYHLTRKSILFLKLYDTMHKEDLLYGVSGSEVEPGRTR